MGGGVGRKEMTGEKEIVGGRGRDKVDLSHPFLDPEA